MADKSNPEQLKDKLLRAMQTKAVLTERSRLLQQQIDDARRREESTDHVVNELLDRQRESNFMLHRANSVLHRLQETNLALSSEFTELVKELPAPNSPDWEQRVAKINDLFRKTGELADEVQDEVFRNVLPDEPKPTPERRETHRDPAPQPVAEAAPAVAPEPAPTPKPEQQVEQPALTPEPVFEAAPMEVQTKPEPAHGSALDAVFMETHSEKHAEDTYSKRVDRLFSKLTSDSTPADRPVRLLDIQETPESSGPGLLSRLKSRMSRKSRVDNSPDQDDGTVDKAS